jgi:hypothetical protein
MKYVSTSVSFGVISSVIVFLTFVLFINPWSAVVRSGNCRGVLNRSCKNPSFFVDGQKPYRLITSKGDVR